MSRHGTTSHSRGRSRSHSPRHDEYSHREEYSHRSTSPRRRGGSTSRSDNRRQRYDYDDYDIDEDRDRKMPRRHHSPVIPPSVSVPAPEELPKLNYLLDKLRRFGPSLDRMLKHRIPPRRFVAVPIYKVNALQAPKTSRFIFFESLNPGLPLPAGPYQPLETMGTKAVVGLLRGESSGLYLKNGISKGVHYEVESTNLDSYLEKADARHISTKYYRGNGEVIHDREGDRLYAITDTHQSDAITTELELVSLASELLLSGELLLEKGKRGNRMLNFGYTGCQSGKTEQYTYEPTITPGTEALANLFAKCQLVTDHLSEQAGFPIPFQGSEYGLDLAKKIHPSNRAGYLGLGFYREDFPFSSELDSLIPHADTETSSHERDDYILVAYRRLFSAIHGCWLTIIVTFSSRKSVDQSERRKDRVDEGVDQLWNLRSQLPRWQRSITRDTFCPTGQPYRIEPINLHTLVTSAVVVCAVEEFASLFESHVQQGFPEEYAIDLIYSFTFTNNPTKWRLFTKHLIKLFLDLSKWPVEKEQTITSLFLEWCVQKYGALDGFKSLVEDNVVVGAARMQSFNTHPVLRATVHASLQELLSLLKWMNSNGPTPSGHKRAIGRMIKHVFGIGSLMAQKVINMVVTCRLVKNPNWLLFVESGSPQHFKMMQKEPFSLDTKEQVSQIIVGLALKHSIPMLESEEMCCFLTKSQTSREAYFDSVFAKDDIIDAELQSGSIELVRCLYGTDIRVRVKDIAFGSTSNICWQSRAEVNIVWIPSVKAYFENKELDEESLTSQKAIKKAQLACYRFDAGVETLQLMINSNKFLAVRHILPFTAKAIGVEPEQLIHCLHTEERREGWVTFVGENLITHLGVTHFKQVHTIKDSRSSLLGRRVTQGNNVYWDSKESAMLACLVHLLLNLRIKFGSHWAVPHLKKKDEFVFLVSVDDDSPSTTIAVATIFRLLDGIYARLVNPATGALEPKFKVATTVFL
jgi:hypothetical protein